MTAGDQREQHAIDHLALAHDQLAHLLAHALEEEALLLDLAAK
jgi:hypothetical protein